MLLTIIAIPAVLFWFYLLLIYWIISFRLAKSKKEFDFLGMILKFIGVGLTIAYLIYFISWIIPDIHVSLPIIHLT